MKQLACLLCLTLSAAMGWAQPALKDAIPMDKAVRIGKLDNGMTYYIRQNKKPEHRAELRLALNAGSLLETDDQQGLAHFCEHMCFNGTKKFAKNELIHFLESVGTGFGAHLNAYTSFDETVYMLQLRTDSAGLMEKGLEVLEEWAQNVTFDGAEIDKERGVVIEEWRMRRGAYSRMSDKYYPVLFHESRYADRLPIGQKAVLDTFHHDVIKAFYHTWYRPDLMAVVVVGDFDPGDMEKQIRKRFGAIPAAKNKPVRTSFPVPDHKDTKIVIVTDKEATDVVARVHHKMLPAIPRTNNDLRNELCEQLYNIMLRARYEELAHQPDAALLSGYSFNQLMARTREAHVLYGRCTERRAAEAFRQLQTESERVRRFGFTETELARAKMVLLARAEQGLRERDKRTSDDLVDECVNNFLETYPIVNPEHYHKVTEAYLPSLKLTEVNALAKAWLKSENRVVVLTGPEKEGLTMPTEAEVRAILTEIETQPLEPWKDEEAVTQFFEKTPTPGKVVKTEKIEHMGATVWTLQNGVRVVVRPTDFNNDEVLMRATKWGGLSQIADADYLSAEAAAEYVGWSGIDKFTDVQLNRALAGKVASVWTHASDYNVGLSGNSRPADLETMLQLTHLYLTAPRSDSAAFEAFRKQRVAGLVNRQANPMAHFYDTLTTTLAQHNFRRQPPSMSKVEAWRLDQSVEAYKRMFGDASGLAFFFVGNLDLAAFQPMVEQYLGSLPASGRAVSWRDDKVRYPAGVVEKKVVRGREPKSVVSLAFTGPFDWSPRERVVSYLMSQVLEHRLLENLREEKGGIYTVSVRMDPDQIPEPMYALTVDFGCAPENVDRLVQATFDEIKRIQAEGPLAADLQKAKEVYVRDMEASLKNNNYWLAALYIAHVRGEAPRPFNELMQQTRSVKPEEVQEAARKYANFNRYVRVVLTPESAP